MQSLEVNQGMVWQEHGAVLSLEEKQRRGQMSQTLDALLTGLDFV